MPDSFANKVPCPKQQKVPQNSKAFANVTALNVNLKSLLLVSTYKQQSMTRLKASVTATVSGADQQQLLWLGAHPSEHA